jgi:hypothetical protein
VSLAGAIVIGAFAMETRGRTLDEIAGETTVRSHRQ